MKTYQYRLKDAKICKQLNQMSAKVNYIWNYCVDLQRQVRDVKKQGRSVKYFSKYDLQSMTSGVSKELGLNSAIIQLVAHRFNDSSLQHKRIAKFRSYKRNLPWIPFDKRCISITDNGFKVNGLAFKVFIDRELQGKILCGSISCNTQGKWFVNITTDHTAQSICGHGEVGIDLGSKDLATLSNGTKYSNPKHYRKYEKQLAIAQKAKKKKLVKKIHTKIKNSRKDYIHKITTEIAKNNKLIVVGDIGSKKLAKTKMAKSVNDASWAMIKTLLEYKAKELGGVCVIVNEKFTSRVCNACGVISDNSPKGLAGLKIREWQCNDCGTNHDRDLNASLNILALGREGLANKRVTA